MNSKLIHLLLEKEFEVWRFAVTSFDIITGMEICLAQSPSSFTSVGCMWKRDTGNVFHGVCWMCMSKRGVCTDIDSIYHSVTDIFVTGLQLSFYLTYMGSHDRWKEVLHEYSPILCRISCISLGRGSRRNRYFLYKDIYRSAMVNP